MLKNSLDGHFSNVPEGFLVPGSIKMYLKKGGEGLSVSLVFGGFWRQQDGRET